MNPDQELSHRESLLEQAEHNLMLIPEELVTCDFLTDSLLHKRIFHKASAEEPPRSVRMELEKRISELFGFPYIVPFAQGRLAEAVIFNIVIRKGTKIPSNGPFPTTRAHIELNGGTLLEMMDDRVLNAESAFAFKGNLDVRQLGPRICTESPCWTSCVALEPCNNASGGHPISMENIKAVHAVAKNYGVPLHLDACRILENAVFVSQREPDYRDHSVWDIVREICSYADFCTFSATKDIPVSCGGFLAVRDAAIYSRCLDLSAALGTGLSLQAMEDFLEALQDSAKLFGGIRKKMSLVELFHGELSDSCPVTQPVGGHAVFLDIGQCNLGISRNYHPEKAFLHHLYRYYGVRGAENPTTRFQATAQQSLVRFAVPLIGSTEQEIRQAAQHIKTALREKEAIEGLEKTGQPPGLTGGMRASYRPVSRDDV